jgi:hypothetical protein
MTTTPEHMRPRTSPGRPSRLTPEVQARIVDAVRVGNYLKVAAQAAGVGQSTLSLWLATGRNAAQAVADHAPHDEDGDPRLFCPGCDTDRTEDVQDLQEEQARLDEEHQRAAEAYRVRVETGQAEADEEPPPHTSVVLGPCPSCHDNRDPEPFTLPPYDTRCLEFLEAVTAAEAGAEVAAVVALRAGFGEDWKAARDFLRMRRPERWASTTRIQMSTDEAERRLEDAVNETLTALGVDATADDATAAAVAELLGGDLDDDDQGEHEAHEDDR